MKHLMSIYVFVGHFLNYSLQFVGSFHSPIHLRLIQCRVLVVNLELSADFPHQIIIEIASIVRDYGIRLSVSTYDVMLHELSNDNLCH